MPSFNFKKQFANAIESGEKHSTVRPKRKHRPAPGQLAHLFTGLRTQHCRKLGCCEIVSVDEIYIGCFGGITVNGTQLEADQADHMAKVDGFKNQSEMVAWFDDLYGLPFHGDIITWSPNQPTR